MLTNTEEQLKREIIQLRDKLNNQQEERQEILNQFELVIVETTFDLRIANSYGAVDKIFKAAIKNFERAENLLKIVYKVTKNSRGLEDGESKPFDEMDYLEDTLNKFVEGRRKELTLRVVGENEDGEIFLLIWKLKRLERSLMHYFKTIPTNAIIKASNEKHNKEIKAISEQAYQIYDNVSDGIIILDLEQKIKFLNQSIKDNIILRQSKLLRNSDFENRYFKDIFITGTIDEIKSRVDANKRVIYTKTPDSYNAAISNIDFLFKVNPIFNEKKELTNLLILVTPNKEVTLTVNDKKLELSKLIQIIRVLSQEKNQHKQRIAELENNQQWLMNNSKQSSDVIKYLNSLITYFPTPISVQNQKDNTFAIVNKAFEKLFNVKKENSLGKTHYDILDKDTVKLIETKAASELNNSQISVINSKEITIKQTLFYDMSGNKQILRVYCNNNNQI
ncbi:MAG: hypothetical protein GX121_03455, partial [Ignavibacteria bacterium]|nr:hypothetical protein [Ignavibacteria bacterium]